MIRHHPDHNMLLEYAAGTLPWGFSLAVSAHIQLCPQCRQQHLNLNSVGGNLLEDCEAQEVVSDSFAQLMRRIDRAEQEKTGPAGAPAGVEPCGRNIRDPALANLPPVIGKLVRGNIPLKWRRVSPALKMSRLKTGQDRYEVAFHRIGSGGKVAEHDHRGHEITLVLHGSFSDTDGIYSRGDFLLREPGEVHRPMATQDRECLCFSVLEAPVTVTGFLGWLINPFLPFRPG